MCSPPFSEATSQASPAFLAAPPQHLAVSDAPRRIVSIYTEACNASQTIGLSPASDMQPSTCAICDQSDFVNEEAYRAHCIELHEYCVQCHRQFRSKLLLLMHVRILHSLNDQSLAFPGASIPKPNSSGDSASATPGPDIHTEPESVSDIRPGEMRLPSPTPSSTNLSYGAISTENLKKGLKRCKICKVSYPRGQDFKNHCIKEHIYCEPCNRLFRSTTAIESHKQSLRHFSRIDLVKGKPHEPVLPSKGSYGRKCRRCPHLYFNSKETFEKHCMEVHEYCHKCRGTYATKRALNSHTRKKHKQPSCRCAKCGKSFENEDSLKIHIVQAHQSSAQPMSSNVASATCESCQIRFDCAEDLLEHRKTDRRHNWCFVCDMDFPSTKRLESHLAKVHKSLNHKCLLCSEAFCSPSAVAMHIESGVCHNVTRNQVTAAVHSLGVIPSISINPMIIESGCPVRPEPITSYVATKMAWDGITFRCWLCRDGFKLLRDLNNHLNSPAHDKVEFKCPKASCDKEFKLVSGLIQHIESGACNLASYKQVEDYAENLTAQFSRLLLN